MYTKTLFMRMEIENSIREETVGIFLSLFERTLYGDY